LFFNAKKTHQLFPPSLHPSDWLPTFLSLATDKEWQGGYGGQTIDGKDMWASLLDNNMETQHEEVVHWMDEFGNCSYQYKMLKLQVKL